MEENYKNYRSATTQNRGGVGALWVDYSVYYSSKGWVGRKIVAVPGALYCATLKPLGHLLMAALSGVYGYKEASKKCLGRVGRDFQESLGGLTMLFYDKAGSYLVHSASYIKKHGTENNETLYLTGDDNVSEEVES